MNIREQIEIETRRIAALLLAKNDRYGNSALDPIRLFARGASAVAQLEVRIDDKLSRVARGTRDDLQKYLDNVDDLIGYLILYRIALGIAADRAENAPKA
jgi:hypothetical protein